MTIATSTGRAQYNGNGATVLFTVPFYFLDNSHLQVVVTSSAGVDSTKVLTTDYTVSGAGNPAGGSITMLSAPAIGEKLAIIRSIPITQTTDLVDNDPLPAEVLETSLDKAAMIDQQLAEKLDRALIMSAGTTVSGQLPDAATRADKLLAFDASGDPTVVVPPTGTAAALQVDLASTAAGKGAAMVGFLQTGTGTVARTALDKMRDEKSLLDFAGANADAKFAAAKSNGTKWLRIPQGDHTITGWSIAESDSLLGLIFEPGARLLVTAALNRIGLDIQKNYFRVYGDLWIESTGTALDALATVGVRHGHPTLGGKAYCEIDRIRYAGFSSRGFVSYQPVYIGIGSVLGTGATGSAMYGVTIDTANIAGIGIVPGTTVQIGRCYISGARRGIYLNSAGWVELDMPVLEYCGSSTTTDGALHLVSVGTCVIKNIYGEQNGRNIVRDDSTPIFIGGGMFTATAADVVSYSGTPFADRGVVQIRGNKISARKIDYDVNDNADLTIGANVTVPASGGSVQFGNETMLVASGTLTSGTWTTVYSIPSAEQTGSAVNGRALYEYVCYAGTADLSTGFDAGTALNGTLRSYSGSLPAWLRINGTDIQMNVTSSSYGLNYKIVLRRMFPG